LVLEFIFDQTDCRVFESYSRPGHELREFPSLDYLRESDFLESNHGRYSLCLVSRSINCDPIVEEFTLTKTGQKRQRINGPGMFQINEGQRLDTQENALNWSKFAHWNEAGAKQRSNFSDDQLEGVDWKGMRRISGQIQRHIKNKLAVAKIGTRPILPGAFTGLDDSLTLWAGPGVVRKASGRLEIFDR